MSFEVRIAWKGPFQVVGEKIRYTPEDDTVTSENEISKLWLRFNPRGNEIRHFEGRCYGISLIDEAYAPGQSFDYIAGAGVTAMEDIPENMIGQSFPGGLYCVVQRRGTIDEIGAAYRFFEENWLPNSEYWRGTGALFELYDERYRGNDNPDSIMELWFPIRRKQELPIENRIASLFVHVTDLRRAAEWYSELLGLPLREERLNGGPVYWFDLPGTGLVLDSNSGNQSNPNWRQEKPFVMFPTRDIDRAHAYLLGKADVFSDPNRYDGMSYFNFSDPEGNASMVCWTQDNQEYGLPKSNSPILARISGAFINVREMSSSAAWYVDLLGVPLDERASEQSVYSVPVTRGADLLLDHNRYLKQDPFEYLFMFDTDDIQAAYDYAANRGMEFHGELETYAEVSFFILKDPDDNLIMVCQS
ncbi:VOC family protein [Cohnella mopanensis]|uniref:VOC family protein n=1 Tax=Cohnella mopanensis TaxID=2911966 RepID=UPI001EF87A75|nr:VOC family protein [Cohnella mopanensis]